jgi:hypothetical protein
MVELFLCKTPGANILFRSNTVQINVIVHSCFKKVCFENSSLSNYYVSVTANYYHGTYFFISLAAR